MMLLWSGIASFETTEGLCLVSMLAVLQSHQMDACQCEFNLSNLPTSIPVKTGAEPKLEQQDGKDERPFLGTISALSYESNFSP